MCCIQYLCSDGQTLRWHFFHFFKARARLLAFDDFLRIIPARVVIRIADRTPRHASTILFTRDIYQHTHIHIHRDRETERRDRHKSRSVGDHLTNEIDTFEQTKRRVVKICERTYLVIHKVTVPDRVARVVHSPPPDSCVHNVRPRILEKRQRGGSRGRSVGPTTHLPTARSWNRRATACAVFISPRTKSIRSSQRSTCQSRRRLWIRVHCTALLPTARSRHSRATACAIGEATGRLPVRSCLRCTIGLPVLFRRHANCI